MAINHCSIQLNHSLVHSFISFGHCEPSDDDDQCLICFLSCPSNFMFICKCNFQCLATPNALNSNALEALHKQLTANS